MANEMAVFHRDALTLLSRSPGLLTAALLAALSGCSSSLGPGADSGGGTAGTGGSAAVGGSGGGIGGTGGTAGTGGGAAGGVGGCADVSPSDPPFGCRASYAEQMVALCQQYTPLASGRQAAACGSSHETIFGAGFYTIWCWYDDQGSLVAASRCEDSNVYCGGPCISSARWPSPPIPDCMPPIDVCGDGTDAGAD